MRHTESVGEATRPRVCSQGVAGRVLGDNNLLLRGMEYTQRHANSTLMPSPVLLRLAPGLNPIPNVLRKMLIWLSSFSKHICDSNCPVCQQKAESPWGGIGDWLTRPRPVRGCRFNWVPLPSWGCCAPLWPVCGGIYGRFRHWFVHLLHDSCNSISAAGQRICDGSSILNIAIVPLTAESRCSKNVLWQNSSQMPQLRISAVVGLSDSTLHGYKWFSLPRPYSGRLLSHSALLHIPLF